MTDPTLSDRELIAEARRFMSSREQYGHGGSWLHAQLIDRLLGRLEALTTPKQPLTTEDYFEWMTMRDDLEGYDDEPLTTPKENETHD